MAAVSKRFSGSFALLALTVSLQAQSNQHSAADWPSKLKRAAEDAVANKIDEIRASANRPRLKRVSPSVMDVQLVCTAALTGRKVGDPIFAGLETYVANDPSTETESLKEITLGVPKKELPRYSVIVERKANTAPENPTYTVGVARRPSALLEFFAPLFFDVPFKGINEWKKEIAPECRKRKD
jgi:hypothetical protein